MSRRSACRVPAAGVVAACLALAASCSQRPPKRKEEEPVAPEQRADRRRAPEEAGELSRGAARGNPSAFAARWTHVSETSAVVYWRLPKIQDSALSYVLYGETTEYGEKTKVTREPRWAQFHRITGLETGKVYHYRMVNVDPVSKKEARSEDLTFTTEPAAGAVRIPDGLQGPPYVLDRADTRYILTRDVRAAATAFEISAPGATLALDGHTVVFGDNCSEQASGVLVTAEGPVTVCNGHIVDGDRSGDYSAGVQTRWRPHPLTVFGVSTDVHNKCAYPMKIFGRTKGFVCHHNHLYSRVTEIESRHYPGNDLLRMDGIEGDVEVYDNIFTEGCHIGMRIGGSKEARPGKVEIHHNDIRHHQQYVNGYAFAAGCPGADIHHNRVTSTGRCVHLTADGVRFHDNWCDTRGHMTLSDMPQGSRPWKHRRVELHGIKFEGGGSRNCKVYGNFMRITQPLPVDSGGKGVPEDKVTNGVYVSSVATALSGGRLIDTTQRWEPDRWKGYWVRYAPDRPPAEVTGNDATALRGTFGRAAPGPYAIYMKWDYVPATPLNIACYDPNAMNEVYGNEIVAVTRYARTRHGGYGDSGQWASSIYFVGMNRGRAREGEYSIYVHDNVFKSNHLFISGRAAGMDIRIERNRFLLLRDPPPAGPHAVFRGVDRDVMDAVKAGGNRFVGMTP